MKLILVFGIYHSNNEKSIKKNSKGWLDNAANNLQWSMINGINREDIEKIILINTPFIGSYPKFYKQLIYKGKIVEENKKIDKAYEVKFINIVGIKQIARFIGIYKNLNNEIRYNEDTRVLIYSMNTSMILASLLVKIRRSNVKLCLFVPDLPQYMNLGREKNHIRKMLKKVEHLILTWIIHYIDKFVLLTKYMGKYLKINEKKCLIIEGMIDPDKYVINNRKKSKYKNFVYTGTLNVKYGVMELINAFQKIPNEGIRLTLCGNGELASEIINISCKDKRIEYLGMIDHSKIIDIQSNAFALVNPRSAVYKYTKYSFPSKILEYMASGRPVIARKLPGIPNDYDALFYHIEGDGEQGILDTLMKIINKDEVELDRLGQKARNYVIANKSNLKQMRRVIDHLRS